MIVCKILKKKCEYEDFKVYIISQQIYQQQHQMAHTIFIVPPLLF